MTRIHHHPDPGVTSSTCGVTYGVGVGDSRDLEALAAAVTASSVAELSWSGPRGPRVQGVVALLRHGRPAIAFTYADEAVARAVGDADTAALSLTEGRSTGSGFRPLLATGRPRLVEDPDGDVYAADLMLQELHRYPPSRVYVDSPLLQRENWWYLPRLVVELEVDDVSPLPTRSDAEDHVLAVDGPGGPDVRTARVVERRGERLTVAVDAPPRPGAAVLFGQDASFPDLERWAQWSHHGTWDGSVLTVEDAPGVVGLPPTPGLLERWRRHRDLEKRCRAALRRGRTGRAP